MGNPTFISGGTLTEGGAMVHLASGVTTNSTTANIVFTTTAADVNDWSQYQDIMYVYNGSTTIDPSPGGGGGASPLGEPLRLQINNNTIAGNYGGRYSVCYHTSQNSSNSIMKDYDAADYTYLANNAGGAYHDGSSIVGIAFCTAGAYGYIPNPGGGMAKLATSIFGSAQSNEGHSNRSWIGWSCTQVGWYKYEGTETNTILDRTFQAPITELDFYVSTGYFTQDTRIDLYGIFHKMDRT